MRDFVRPMDSTMLMQMSAVMKEKFRLHRIAIQQPVFDLVEECIDMALKHPEIIRPEWDTDTERKAMIEELKTQVRVKVAAFLDKEIGSRNEGFGR